MHFLGAQIRVFEEDDVEPETDTRSTNLRKEETCLKNTSEASPDTKGTGLSFAVSLLFYIRELCM